MRHPNEDKPWKHLILGIYIDWTDRSLERHGIIQNFYLKPQISIINSFYKYKLIYIFNFILGLLTHPGKDTIQEYTCKKSKGLMVVFVRYALIVVGAFDGTLTKLGTCAKQHKYRQICTLYIFL